MSRTGTIIETLKTLGPIPKTMRAGVYREKGIVCVEEVPVPEVVAAAHHHQVYAYHPARATGRDDVCVVAMPADELLLPHLA